MTTAQTIRKLLKRNQRLRDDDRLLTLRVWQEYGFVLNPEQRTVFMHLPSMDIITRRRRELRALYPESPEVHEQRFRYYLGFKDEFSPFIDPELQHALEHEDHAFEPPAKNRWLNRLMRKNHE